MLKQNCQCFFFFFEEKIVNVLCRTLQSLKFHYLRPVKLRRELKMWTLRCKIYKPMFSKEVIFNLCNLVGIMFLNSCTINSNLFMTRELFAFICFLLGAGLLQRIEMEMMALQVFHNWQGSQQQPTQKGRVCFYGKKISLKSCLYFVEKIN